MQVSDPLKISSSADPVSQACETFSAQKNPIPNKSGENLTSVYQKEEVSPDYKIFIGKLPHSITKEQIMHHFSKYGIVKSVSIVHKPKRLNYGFVCFCDHEALEGVFHNLVSASFHKNGKIK